MSNEELVLQIQKGYAVSEKLQLLYDNNLPLIRKIVKPYTQYEREEDLLQEAFFGLYNAVAKYEGSENVLFMSYAGYWIKQAVTRYVQNCGALIRIPTYTHEKIFKYRKAFQLLSQELNRIPTNAELAEYMKMPVGELEKLQNYGRGVSSLDAPLSEEDEGATLGDTIKDDLSVENDTVDKMYREYTKNELWGIVERHTSVLENEVIRQIFIENKTMSKVAEEKGITLSRIRDIKEKGLRRLRIGSAKKELLEKFEIVDASLYNNGVSKFKHYGSSNVEYIAIRRMQLQSEYDERKRKNRL